MTSFTEIQSYSWLAQTGVAALLITIGLLLRGRISWDLLIRQADKDAHAISKRARNYARFASIAYACIAVIAIAFYASRRLYTRIDETGIHYRMAPWQWKEHEIRWNEVSYVYMGHYTTSYYSSWIANPRTGFSSVYSVLGDTGLYVVSAYGTSFILGTQKTGELRQALHELVIDGVIDRNKISGLYR